MSAADRYIMWWQECSFFYRAYNEWKHFTHATNLHTEPQLRDHQTTVAPLCWATMMCKFLHRTFPTRWIARDGPITWLPGFQTFLLLTFSVELHKSQIKWWLLAVHCCCSSLHNTRYVGWNFSWNSLSITNGAPLKCISTLPHEIWYVFFHNNIYFTIVSLMWTV